jgi:hypothetical protein
MVFFDFGGHTFATSWKRPMSNKAIDLSLGELAALGAKAARLSARQAQEAGLTLTGTIDSYENNQAKSSLAQLHPSGTITLVRQSDDGSVQKDTATAKPFSPKAAG